MTQFVGAQSTMVQGGFAADDRRAVGQDWQQDVELSVLSMGAVAPGDYASPWWPGSSGNNDNGVGVSGSFIQADPWGYYEEYGGTISRYGVTGVTRDINGSPLPGCTVKLYRTSSDEMVASIVSDGNGAFVVTTPYADTHYLVTYKAGPPDIFATSINTLAPG